MTDDRTDLRWQEIELKRLGIFALFIAALTAGGLGTRTAEAALGGLTGYGLAVLLTIIWGERTRPKNSLLWWLGGVAWAAGVALSWAAIPLEPTALLVPALISFGFAFFFRHDNGITPTLFVGGAVWASLFLHGRLLPGARGGQLGEGDAVWIALAVLLGITAALLEHERLMRRDGPGTPVPWTVIRLAFVSLWTLIILNLRGEVQWGRLFMLLGANLEGQGGQMLLLGILLVALVIAAVALRPGKRGPAAPPQRR